MPRVVIFGTGPQGNVVLETLRAQGHHEVVGFLDDDSSRQGSLVNGLPVFGGMEWAMANAARGWAAIVAIGNNDARMAIGSKLRACGMELINAVHPSAVVMVGTTIGTGNLICAGVIIVTGTQLEDDIVVNTGATIDHDSMLHTGVYVAPGVHTAGRVTIGHGAFVGVGTVIGPGVRIGAGCVVGAGSVVLSDLPPQVFAFGSPARVVKSLKGPIDWRKILAGE